MIIGGFISSYGFAGTNIGKKVKSSAKGEVERDMAFANGSLLKQSVQSFERDGGCSGIQPKDPLKQCN